MLRIRTDSDVKTSSASVIDEAGGIGKETGFANKHSGKRLRWAQTEPKAETTLDAGLSADPHGIRATASAVRSRTRGTRRSQRSSSG